MLIGIVVTNAIVLLDLVERLKSEGHSTRDALIEGGRTRIRPILMTAIATILALVPLASGLNEGSIIAAELGTVVIGGLLSSTFLTLVVVPSVYSMVDGAKGWARRASDEPMRSART
jgi:HAE1 family hydrophobic/amphiphilic exporter-1